MNQARYYLTFPILVITKIFGPIISLSSYLSIYLSVFFYLGSFHFFKFLDIFLLRGLHISYSLVWSCVETITSPTLLYGLNSKFMLYLSLCPSTCKSVFLSLTVFFHTSISSIASKLYRNSEPYVIGFYLFIREVWRMVWHFEYVGKFLEILHSTCTYINFLLSLLGS